MAGFIFRGPEDLKQVERDTTTGVPAGGVAVGDVLYLSAGNIDYQLGSGTTAFDFHKKLVVTRVYGTADVEGIVVNPNQLWEVQSANNTTGTHDGDRMALTDQNTVNNSATDQSGSIAVVVQRGVIGAAADKRILVSFINCSGIDPDRV